LVEARAAAWPEIPPEARIDRGALSWRRQALLGSGPGIPVRADEVLRALSAALASVPAGSRDRTVKVLDAVGAWVSASVAETQLPLETPASWQAADAVLRAGRGNPFERVRVLVAMLRAAGIPARPSFNGVPVVVLFVTPVGASPTGDWTVWDPLHPSGSFRKLPVAWLPLRAGEVPLASTTPPGIACRPSASVRRCVGRGEADRAYETAGRIGAFPSNPAEPLPVNAAAWWEVWIMGVAFDADPGRVSVTVPLPFVPELRTGTRGQVVWVSDPSRLKAVEPISETDQRLGGLTHSLRVQLGPSRVETTRGVSPDGETPKTPAPPVP
jgi:hypothetical protein